MLPSLLTTYIRKPQSPPAPTPLQDDTEPVEYPVPKPFALAVSGAFINDDNDGNIGNNDKVENATVVVNANAAIIFFLTDDFLIM